MKTRNFIEEIAPDGTKNRKRIQVVFTVEDETQRHCCSGAEWDLYIYMYNMMKKHKGLQEVELTDLFELYLEARHSHDS